MTLTAYAKAVRQHLVVIVLLTLLGGGLGLLHASAEAPQYRSSSSVLLTSDLGGSASDLVQSSTYIQNIVASYVLLTNSDVVLVPVIKDLELETTPKVLAGRVRASSPLNTTIVDISVDGTDPREAQRIAASVTENLSEAVSEVSPQAGNKDPSIRLTTIKPADLPSFAISPNKRVETALGLIIGGLLGLAYSLGRRIFGVFIGDEGDIATVTDLPVVGEILEARRGTDFAASLLREPLSVQAESMRSFAVNLSFLQLDRQALSFVVTSPSPGESKSSVALGLSWILTESVHRVLLIDADLRSPSIADMTNLEPAIGLSTVLVGETSLQEAVQPWASDGLDVLTSGSMPPNPAQLLSSDAMTRLLAEAEQQYDVVIVDSAPLLSVTDAVWLSHVTSGALVIARRGKTNTRSLAKALGVLDAGKAVTLGVVITRVRRRARRYYGASAKPPHLTH